MTREELKKLVEEVQQRCSELDNVEVKTARGGTPQRLYEPLFAFANRTGGGVLLLGIAETSNFAVVGVGDVHRLQEEITHLTAEISPELPAQLISQSEEDKILAYVRQSGSITNTERRTPLNVDEARAYYLLKKLCDAIRLQPVGKGKGRRYVLS